MDLQKYLEMYLSDGREHVAALREALEGGSAPGAEEVRELFRHAHSLKGMAASMNFEATSRLAHSLETILGVWRDGADPAPPAIEASLRAVDMLDDLMDVVQAEMKDEGLSSRVDEVIIQLEAALPEEASAEKPAGPAPGTGETPPAATEPSDASQEPDKETAKLTVTIEPGSPLPAARLLVVAQHLEAEFGPCPMAPSLAEVQQRALRSVVFRVPAGPGIKEAARALRELPEVEETELEMPGAPSPAPEKPGVVQSVRIRAAALDDLLAGSSELLYHLNRLEAELSPAEQQEHHFWLERHRALLNRHFDHILSIRLLPFDILGQRLARTVRELSSRTGKPLKFEMTGADQRLDRTLLERLLDPLTHLIRNAADHGIESPSARKSAGKPEEGTIALTVQREGEALLVSIGDDGRGLDENAIREAAVKRELLTDAQSKKLPRAKILELITLPAFSTRREVTDISGRGVGLDVVRAAVEALGGYLEMDSVQGQGTLFTLVVPSAVTLTSILVFGWDRWTRYGLPTSQVRRIYALAAHPLVRVGPRLCIQHDNGLIPVLGFRPRPVGREGFALSLDTPSGERALLVSRVFQSERVVILPWGAPLDMVPYWIGGALLSTGEISYIMDSRALLRIDPAEEENVLETV
ncbi:MAG: Hpt domain-containing protein [Acidobacteriota bacterium]